MTNQQRRQEKRGGLGAFFFPFTQTSWGEGGCSTSTKRRCIDHTTTTTTTIDGKSFMYSLASSTNSSSKSAITSTAPLLLPFLFFFLFTSEGRTENQQNFASFPNQCRLFDSTTTTETHSIITVTRNTYQHQHHQRQHHLFPFASTTRNPTAVTASYHAVNQRRQHQSFLFSSFITFASAQTEGGGGYALGMIRPIAFLSSDGSPNVGQQQLDAIAEGVEGALFYQNAVGGGVRGENVTVASFDLNLATATSATPAIESIINTSVASNRELVAFTMGVLDVVLESVIPTITAKGFTLVGAIGRDPRLRETFTRHLVHLLPSPEAELLTQLDYVIHTLRYKRFLLLINVYNDNPIEQHIVYPVYLMMVKKLAEVGIPREAVLLQPIDARVESPLTAHNTTWTLNGALLNSALPFKPQAVFSASPASVTATQFIGRLMFFLPNVYVGLLTVHGSMVDAMVANTPAPVVGDRLTITLPLPLYSSDKPIAKAFRNEMALAREHGAVTLDVSGTGAGAGYRGQFAFLAWVHARFSLEVMRAISPNLPINKSTFMDAVFNFRIQPIHDMFFGMYGNDCTTFSGAACRCNQGGKFIWMSKFNQAAQLSPIDGVLVAIPTDKCDTQQRSGEDDALTLKNPMIQLRVYPEIVANSANPLQQSLTADERVKLQSFHQTIARRALFGAKARSVSTGVAGSTPLTASSSRSTPTTTTATGENFNFLAIPMPLASESATHRFEYKVEEVTNATIVFAMNNPIVGGGEALLGGDQTEKTASTAGVEASSSSSPLQPRAPITPLVIDPIRLHPSPHDYQRRVIKVTATLDQEIHAIAAMAATAHAGGDSSSNTNNDGQTSTAAAAAANGDGDDFYFGDGSTRSVSLVIPNTVPASYRQDIIRLVEQSLNTFGLRTAAVYQGANSLAEALNGIVSSGADLQPGSLFILMGMEAVGSDFSSSGESGDVENDAFGGKTDAEAIVAFLSKFDAVKVIIPHEYIVIYHAALRNAMAKISSSSASSASSSSPHRRLLFTSSIGSWNTTIAAASSASSTSSSRQSVESQFVHSLNTTLSSSSSSPATDVMLPTRSSATTPQPQQVLLSSARTPAALLGFVTQSFASRVLTYLTTNIITSDLVTSAVYSMAVVSVVDGLVVGPFDDTPCLGSSSSSSDAGSASGSQGGSCELNAGARSVSVLNFAVSSGIVAVPLSSSSSSWETTAPALFTQYYSSSRITYLPLPPGPGPNIGLIVGVAVGASAAAILCLMIGVSLFLKWKKSAAAPKDASEPFTLMFTDIQSSTTLWADLPEAMSKALSDHHTIIRRLIRSHNGYEVKTVGDCFMIAFKDPHDAVCLAKQLQLDFLSHDWGTFEIDAAYKEREWELAEMSPAEYPKPLLSAFLPDDVYQRLWNGLRVRVGIHYGFGEIILDPVSKRYDYYGTVANVAARIESAGHGGQVLMSRAVIDGAGIDCCSTQHHQQHQQHLHHGAVKGGVEGEEANAENTVIIAHTNNPQVYSTTSSTAGANATAGFRAMPIGDCVLRGVPEPVSLHQLIVIEGRLHPPLRQDHTPAVADELEGRSGVGGDSGVGTSDAERSGGFGMTSLSGMAQSGFGGGVGGVMSSAGAATSGGAGVPSLSPRSPQQQPHQQQQQQRSNSLTEYQKSEISRAPTGIFPRNADGTMANLGPDAFGKEMVSIVLGVLTTTFPADAKRLLLQEVCKHWQLKANLAGAGGVNGKNNSATSAKALLVERLSQQITQRLGPIAQARLKKNTPALAAAHQLLAAIQNQNNNLNNNNGNNNVFNTSMLISGSAGGGGGGVVNANYSGQGGAMMAHSGFIGSGVGVDGHNNTDNSPSHNNHHHVGGVGGFSSAFSPKPNALALSSSLSQGGNGLGGSGVVILSHPHQQLQLQHQTHTTATTTTTTANNNINMVTVLNTPTSNSAAYPPQHTTIRRTPPNTTSIVVPDMRIVGNGNANTNNHHRQQQQQEEQNFFMSASGTQSNNNIHLLHTVDSEGEEIGGRANANQLRTQLTEDVSLSPAAESAVAGNVYSGRSASTGTK